MSKPSTPLTKEKFLEELTKLASQYEEGIRPVIGMILCLDPSKPTELMEWNGEKFQKRNVLLTFSDLDNNGNKAH
jgi:hypothetical protein